MKNLLIALFLLTVTSATAQTPDSTIIKIDAEAQFLGGKSKFLKYYLQRVGSVVDKLEEQKYSGTCEISFDVDSMGYISNAQIVTCDNTTFGYFLLEFIEKNPRWIPAKKGNTATASTKKEKFTFRSSAYLKQ